jgi:hypothetical protein
MVLNLRKPLNLALLCYACIVWVLTEIALVLLFAQRPQSPGLQVGTGMACDTVRLCLAVTKSVDLVVTAPATKPAKTREKMDAWTKSFMTGYLRGVRLRFYVEEGNNQEYSSQTS